MSDDIKRLQSWMKSKELGNKELARAMNIPYITVHTIIERRGATTDQFVNRFIRRFGYDVAREVFASHLAPVAETEVTQ